VLGAGTVLSSLRVRYWGLRIVGLDIRVEA
jgi:hypothetical protein